ncbi:superoxide dismutase [Anaerobacillus alkalilacustris]|uniref:superoxide dismutase n=1 Tax=Anaerobacillus alkalilacustris TaxID=393763 RepID=A0A1S2LGU2_9BACI|nr:superoxide dismutase [Anaerobacillus alkalilacustris]OIJ10705.1 superoxide dismutase [Anaerobacillus alkalilacustris]
MEQRPLTQFEDLLDWCKEFRFALTNNETRGNEHLINRVISLENDLVNLNTSYLSNEESVHLYEKANELYREFNPNDLYIEENPVIEKRKELNAKRVPIGEHKLPPLPYAYNALEPFINEEIMRLHHSEHHKSYVDGLNKAEKEMEKARRKNNFDLIRHWEREAAFNGAGHYLHTIFWMVMSPKGGGTARGTFAEQINLDFGSFEQFKEHFSEAAKNVEAVGWAILVWSPRANRLEILQAEKHQNLTQWDVIPILPLDVWEHAYYLQYKNNRDLYVDNWWNLVNWDHVAERFMKAKQLHW